MIGEKGDAMTLKPSGYGGLLNPYEQLEKNGYYLVSHNPEMKVADKSHVLRQVVIDYLDALAQMNSERHVVNARAYFEWLMRDEGMRQRAVERYKRRYGQRLGTVDIWEHTLTDLLEDLENDLMGCSPPGYNFGPVPWTEEDAGFFPEEWYENPEFGKQEYETRNQRT
jgi:hypothetical protein